MNAVSLFSQRHSYHHLSRVAGDLGKCTDFNTTAKNMMALIGLQDAVSAMAVVTNAREIRANRWTINPSVAHVPRGW